MESGILRLNVWIPEKSLIWLAYTCKLPVVKWYRMEFLLLKMYIEKSFDWHVFHIVYNDIIIKYIEMNYTESCSEAYQTTNV